MHIASIAIAGSPFFDQDLDLRLSSKLNCIMGSRGSGKTTVLSIANWALAEDSQVSRDTLNLIKANLGSGTVSLQIMNEAGQVYNVTKTLGSAPDIRAADGKAIGLEEFRKTFSIDYFPSGSIERIGQSPLERLKLFDSFIGSSIEAIKQAISIRVANLKQNELELRSVKKDHARLKEEESNYSGIAAEIDSVQKEFANVEADEKVKKQFEEENAKQHLRTMEASFLEKSKEIISKINDDSKRLEQSLISAKAHFQSIEKFTTAETEAFSKRAAQIVVEMEKLFSPVRIPIAPLGKDLVDSAQSIKAIHIQAESAFSGVRQSVAKHRETFQKLNLLSQKQTAHKLIAEKISKATTAAKSLEADRDGNLKTLLELIGQRSALRVKCAAEINERLGDKVKILVRADALNDQFQELLRTVVNKKQMRMSAVETKIIEVSSPVELVRFFKEAKSEFYATKLGVDKGRILELFEAIREQDAIYDFETCICDDSPNFFLAIEESKGHEAFKPTEQLSTGQRCTAVLPIIFALTNSPLLIDQPEDNLDNRYITDSIHQIVRNVKNSRQLVFVTHNPNIPVISDAEFNVFLSFSNKKSSVLKSGKIDAVGEQIVELLEGGKVAFVRRKEFYGY